MRYIISAISIDGPVYAIEGGWTEDVREAESFTKEDAACVVAEQQRLNRMSDSDWRITKMKLKPLYL